MNSPAGLSTVRATSLYVGALLGPSLLLLPGLAAAIAGPASIVDWLGLLVLSGLFAWVFTALGRRFHSRGGVAVYAAAGLGARAGRAVAWCFLTGAVVGAPVVCLIGGAYVAAVLGGGRGVTLALAAALLAVVVALTLGGARTTSGAQLAMVALLIGLVVLAVCGSASHLRTANWSPFAPAGTLSIGHAASVLMLSFVGWEAIAPMTARLRDPDRQLPRVITSAFAITSSVYLALALATIGVLGSRAASAVPLADLLRVAIGPAGQVVAAVAAVALTLAATNAYLSGAAELAADLRGDRAGWGLQVAIAATGTALLGATASGLVTTAQLVMLPTAMFLTVYLGCTASAARILTGRVRLAAAVAFVVVVVVLAFSEWALVAVLLVVVASSVQVDRRVDQPGREVGRERRADEQQEVLGVVAVDDDDHAGLGQQGLHAGAARAGAGS
jgi:amino acid efflux transporter